MKGNVIFSVVKKKKEFNNFESEDWEVCKEYKTGTQEQKWPSMGEILYSYAIRIWEKILKGTIRFLIC